MNWTYTFGKNMTVTDQHKKYWHIESYETDESEKKGYIVDTLDISDIDNSSFLKRNTGYKVGTIESASFDWSSAVVNIKRYESVLTLAAPEITLNGSTTTQYTLNIKNPNDPLAPTLAPTATFYSENLGDTTYDIKPGESINLDFTWSKAADEPESVTYYGYLGAFHCNKSDTTTFIAKKTVTPKDLVPSASISLDSSTGAFKSLIYSISNPNNYSVKFVGTLKLDGTTLQSNFTIAAGDVLTGTSTTDGFSLILDGTVTA